MSSQETLRYLETDSNPYTLTVAQQFQTMTSRPTASKEMNEKKPRLGKDEVDILEREFKRNPKPTTQTKRQFSEDMGVDISRINNWFQNRRAKRKQEKKQEAYEDEQAQEALGQYSEPSSPDFYYANSPIPEPTAPFGLPGGPPPPVALYNPQYSDPTTASTESLHRTLAAAQAAAKQQDSKTSFSKQNKTLELFEGSFFRYSFSNAKTHSSPRAHDDLPLYPDKSRNSQSPEDCPPDTPTMGKRYDTSEPEQWSFQSVPSNIFNSPPLPMGIASRRHKVCHKPAALIADTLRSKPRVKSAQRSSIFLGKFPESFMEQNCHTIRLPPSLTAGSSLNSSLDPPTPKSPREREMTLVNREMLRSTVLLNEGSMSFVFNARIAGCSIMKGDQDLALSPEIPQAQMVMHTSSKNWLAVKFSEKQWSFEVPDEPLFTPARKTFPFPLELHTPQPTYLTSMSRIVKPAFGHFNPNLIFMSSDNASRPASRIDKQATSTPAESKNQPHFDTPDEPRYILMAVHMPQPSYLRATKPPKTFAFSHTTKDDFLDECKPCLYNTNSVAEDRGEQPQPIKTGLSPVLAVFDGGRSVTGTSKVKEVKIEVETDCHPEVGHQDEEVSEDDSRASDKTELFGSSYMKACNAILRSALDRQEEEQDDLILPILDPMRQALVERIMDEFYLIFNHNWAARITHCPGGCSPTSGDGEDRSRVVDKVSLPTSQQKRQRSHDEDSADESGNKKPRRQRGGPRPPGELNNLARFACPFRKHDPQKYSIHSHRVCALTSWDTIARVKEHLYRNHKAAPYCKRCWKVFEAEEVLDSHATVPATSICEALPGHPPEGITPKMVAELRSKAKPYSKQNEGDRWKEIFRLLFPGETVPSPYWEPVHEHLPSSPNSQVLVRYDDYMHRELPRLFRSRVEEVVRQEMQPVEASLLANLESLIRECQDQLSSGYRETHTTEQQSEVSSMQPTEILADPVNPTTTAEQLRMITVEKDQQLSSDFFDAVLQPPPLWEEDYVLDFSASDIELFGSHKHTPSDNLSDSGYVSVPRCRCKELCRCLTSMIGFENRDVDISEPSFVDLAQDLEVQARGVQWQNWLENRD